MKSYTGKQPMEQIELETDFSKDLNKRALKEKPASLEEPMDLEPYLDFLEEIEAFDTPKQKRVYYDAEFEL